MVLIYLRLVFDHDVETLGFRRLLIVSNPQRHIVPTFQKRKRQAPNLANVGWPVD